MPDGAPSMSLSDKDREAMEAAWRLYSECWQSVPYERGTFKAGFAAGLAARDGERDYGPPLMHEQTAHVPSYEPFPEGPPENWPTEYVSLDDYEALRARVHLPGPTPSDLQAGPNLGVGHLPEPARGQELREAAEEVLDYKNDFPTDLSQNPGWNRAFDRLSAALGALPEPAPLGGTVEDIDDPALCWSKPPCDCGKRHKGDPPSPPEPAPEVCPRCNARAWDGRCASDWHPEVRRHEARTGEPFQPEPAPEEER